MSLPHKQTSSFSPTNTVETGSLLPQVCVIRRLAQCIPRAPTKFVLFTNQPQFRTRALNQGRYEAFMQDKMHFCVVVECCSKACSKLM